MINILGYFMGQLGALIRDVYSMLKEVIFLLVFIAALIIGLVTRNILVIVLASALLMVTMGSIESDRGVQDITYIIKGKRVLAKKFLKRKPEKPERAWGFGFWDLGSLLILLVIAIAVLAIASIPILIIASIIMIFVGSWILSLVFALILAGMGMIALYFKVRDL